VNVGQMLSALGAIGSVKALCKCSPFTICIYQ